MLLYAYTFNFHYTKTLRVFCLIFWLRDESLSDSDNLPEPGVIAAEIVADLEAALEQFRLIAEDLGPAEAGSEFPKEQQ